MVTTMSVTDGDEPHTPAWNSKFKIVSGDPGGLFNVTTGSNKREGIITTVKVGSKAEIVKFTTMLLSVHLFYEFCFSVPFCSKKQNKNSYCL